MFLLIILINKSIYFAFYLLFLHFCLMKSCQNLLVIRGLIRILHIFISGCRHWLCCENYLSFLFFGVFSLHGAHFATHPYLTFQCFSVETLTGWNHKTWLLLHQICIMRAAICNMRSFPLPWIVALIKTNTRLTRAMPEPRRTLYPWAPIIYEAWPRRRLLSECNSACKSQKWNG